MDTDPEAVDSSGFLMKTSDLLRTGVENVTLTINEYDHLDQLTKGELIQWPSILEAMFHLLVFPGILIVVLGIVCFYMREFGLVIKR